MKKKSADRRRGRSDGKREGQEGVEGVGLGGECV